MRTCSSMLGLMILSIVQCGVMTGCSRAEPAPPPAAVAAVAPPPTPPSTEWQQSKSFPAGQLNYFGGLKIWAEQELNGDEID